MKKLLIRGGQIVGVLLLIAIVLFATLLIFLSVTEFKPAQTMELDVLGNKEEQVPVGREISLLTWNVGNAVLGDNADFFMDGGTHVKTSSKERMEENLAGITQYIQSVSPQIIFFQELDVNSARSYHTDQQMYLMNALQDYSSSFARNYSCRFVPFPFPPLGRMDSGIDTFSSYRVASAERESLPVPFSWPVRMANLKRCLLISRLPVEGSDRELVLVNLHLEAYDQGEGKAAQTQMLRTLIDAEREKGNYVIAGGDFNQTFSGSASDLFPEIEGVWHAGMIENNDFDSRWQMLMDKDTPSCRSLDRPFAGAERNGFQFYQIDGLIVSDNIAVSSYEVDDLDFAYSDHNPLRMTFMLKE